MAPIFLALKTGIYIVRNGVVSLQSHNHQCRREGGEGGTKYRGPGFPEGGPGFNQVAYISFSVVPLFVDCAN